MIEKYHKYVFDDNQFVGKFEEMYQNEKDYDSWYQSDLRDLGYQLSLSILNQYNFDSILDIGCGKGLFTSLLKKENNKVIGIDTSITAIQKAKSSFKDIDFQNFTVTGTSFIEIFKVYKSPFDLIVYKEILSYIKSWKDIIRQSKHYTKYIFVSLDLPEKPAGFVKSFKDLEREIKKHFDILVNVFIKTTGSQMLILGKVKA